MKAKTNKPAARKCVKSKMEVGKDMNTCTKACK